MSIPPDFNIPDDVYQPGTGSQYGQSFQGMTMDQARNYLQAPYQVSYGNIGQVLIDTLGGILQSVMDGIIAGAQALGMVVSTVIDTISGAIQWVVDGIASLFGVGDAQFLPGSNLEAVRDQQLALNERVDLLADVSGYCSTYQDKNWRVGSGTRQIPFGKQLGPYKNAHPGDGGIYLDAPGTWRIDATATVAGGNGSGPCRFIISVRDPEGQIYSEQWLDAERLSTSKTWAWNTTVVIPEPGYHVRVYWGHPALWWTLKGGTHLSRLSVNRWDLTTGDFVRDEDVPDGGDL